MSVPSYRVKRLILAACVFAVATATAHAQQATAIWHGGPILTMAGDSPEYIEAVAVAEGHILATGSEVEIMALAQENTVINDLDGHTMLPGFIDAHSHFVQTAIKLSAVNLDPPPIGDISEIAEIQKKMTAALKANPPADGEVFWGWGYDNGYLKEQRHPTRQKLDEISTTVPIALYHFSSHIMAVNSKALELIGYDENTPDPEGGVIQREEGSNVPNGVLEETSMFPLLQKLLASAQGERLVELLDNVQQEYLANGYTTVTEMAGEPSNIESLRAYASSGRLKINLMVGAIIIASTPEKIFEQYSVRYENHRRIGGGKIDLDGGSPGRAAFLREPYYTQAEGADTDYRGYSSIKKQADMNKLIVPFYEAKVPIFIHALGDAAIDQAVAAVQEGMKEYPYDDPRTQLIHLQIFQPDQIKTLIDLGVSTSFQIAHNFYFADFHNDVIYGPERTKKLNPMQSALNEGFSVTFHHDSPVHRVNQLDLIWIATNRSSRSNKIYGPEERISAYDALRAATIEGAYQFSEETDKGSIEVGKLADFVVLKRDPMAVEITELKDLKVVQTIKEGETLFAAE